MTEIAMIDFYMNSSYEPNLFNESNFVSDTIYIQNQYERFVHKSDSFGSWVQVIDQEILSNFRLGRDDI